NPELATGDVEVQATKLAVLGPAVTPAIPVARGKGEELPAEELRLRHRHLDLRRPEMQGNLMLRHRLLQRARRTLSDLEFLEIEASFVGMEDVLGYVEAVLVALWDEAGHKIARPFPRITWREAMERYGTDKPDLRYELSIADWTAQVKPLAVPFVQSTLKDG